MRRWGCLGLGAGGLIGLFVVIILLIINRPVSSVSSSPSNTIDPDITIFLSEQSLSRLVSDTLQRPTVIDFYPNGQMQVTTRTEIEGLEPVIHLGLLLELRGTEVVSELQWVRFSFITLPGSWLPPEAAETAALPGQVIESQLPQDFTLVGLNTESDGITIQLKWIGQ